MSTTTRGLLLYKLLFALLLLLPLARSSTKITPKDMYWPTSIGAKCVNLTDVPTLYPGVEIPPVCNSFILWDKVYVDNNTFTRNELGLISMGGSWNAPECIQTNWRMWCTLMFRPCWDIPLNVSSGHSVAIGQYPCRHYCTDTHRACEKAIVGAVKTLTGWTQELIDAALDCDLPWSAIYGDPYRNYTHVFPEGNYTFAVTYQGVDYDISLPCYDGNSNITIAVPTALCPDGLYYQDGLCYFDCPEPLITDSEYDAITTMVSVMGWLSITAASFVALTFLLDPKKRAFPSNLSTFFILCIVCVSFAFCIGTMAGWRNVWCDDEDKPNSFGGPACTIQGMIFVYFSLASVLWWLVISFNMLLFVFHVFPNDLKLDWVSYVKGLRMANGLRRWETLCVAYHLFAWLPPLIPLVISLAAQRLGYGRHDIWCTIHSGDPVQFYQGETGEILYSGGDPANVWNLVLLTIPILLAIALGFSIVLFVMIYGFWKIGWRFLLQEVRLFLFIMFFLWIYAFVFGFQIHLAVQADEQYQEYTKYINCVFVVQNVYASPSDNLYNIGCSTSVDSKVSFPLWFIVCFNEAGQGLFIYLLYGTSLSFYKTWYQLFVNTRSLFHSKNSESSNVLSMHKVEGKKVSRNKPESMLEMVDSSSSHGSTSDSSESEESEEEAPRSSD